MQPLRFASSTGGQRRNLATRRASQKAKCWGKRENSPPPSAIRQPIARIPKASVDALPWLAMSSRSELEIQPEELRRRLDSGEKPVFLDVRRPDEAAICAFEGYVLIPLHELADRMDELDPDQPTVVYCHHGVRSLNATVMLREAGFCHVRSLAGGVDRWAAEIDPAMPRY